MSKPSWSKVATWALVLFLVLAASANAAHSTIFRQLGSGEVIVEFAGSDVPCQTRIYYPAPLIFSNPEPPIFLVELSFSYAASTCLPGMVPASWSQSVNLGLLADGDYQVTQREAFAFPGAPSDPDRYFSIRQGGLLFYENVPVPGISGSVKWLLALLVALGSLSHIRARRAVLKPRSD